MKALTENDRITLLTLMLVTFVVVTPIAMFGFNLEFRYALGAAVSVSFILMLLEIALGSPLSNRVSNTLLKPRHPPKKTIRHEPSFSKPQKNPVLEQEEIDALQEQFNDKPS